MEGTQQLESLLLGCNLLIKREGSVKYLINKANLQTQDKSS